MLHSVSGCKDSKIITFPQGSPLEQIQGVGLTCFLSSPKVHPSKTSSMPLSSSASPQQASPPACAEIWQAAESQGVVGKQLQMNFGSWMKELDNNCSSLSEGNTEKLDPNPPVLSWQCDLGSVTAICVFRFLRHQTNSGTVLIYLEKCGDAEWDAIRTHAELREQSSLMLLNTFKPKSPLNSQVQGWIWSIILRYYFSSK